MLSMFQDVTLTCLDYYIIMEISILVLSEVKNEWLQIFVLIVTIIGAVNWYW
jgi:hypothetical protein